MLTDMQVVFGKVEATEGTAEIMNPATDGLLVLEGGKPTPEGTPVGSKRLSDTLSKSRDTIGQLAMGVTLPCEFRGGGIAGAAVAPPDFDWALRASAMKRTDIVFVEIGVVAGVYERGETVTGGTSGATGVLIANTGGGLLLEQVVGTFQDAEAMTGSDSAATSDAAADPVTGYQYMPTSVDAEKKAATVVYYLDGHKWTTTASRGTFVLDFPTGEKPTIEFTMKGRWNDPEDEENPTPTLLDHDAPLVVGMGIKVGTHAPLGVTSISVDMANNLYKALDMNAADGVRAFKITDREPSGSFDPEAEALAAYNPWADWKNGTLAEMSFLLGSAAGNRIYVSMPKIQKDIPSYGDREKTVVYEQPFKLKKDAGDDELRMVFF